MVIVQKKRKLNDKYNKLFFLLCFLGFFLLLPQSTLQSEISSVVKGKVLDEETGIPIKDVKVYLDNGRKWAVTDEKGEFRITDASPGYNGIAFYPPPPYAWARVDNEIEKFIIEPGKIVFISKKIKTGGSLELHMIETASREPVPGVQVMIKWVNFTLQEKDTSNAQGIYQISQLMPGKYDLVLKKDGFWRKELSNVEIHPKQTTKIDVPYNHNSKTVLSGQVSCLSTGLPFKNILVSVHRQERHGWVHAYTDDNGRYTVLDIEPGKYHIYIFGNQTVNGKTERIEFRKPASIYENKTMKINFKLDCNLSYSKRGDY